MYIEDQSIRKGKNIVIAAIFALVLFSIIELVGYGVNTTTVGYGRIGTEAFNITLTIIISYFLYKGFRWARILVGILMIINSILCLIRIVSGFYVYQLDSLFMAYMVVYFIVNAILGALLLYSKDVKSFMEFQSNKK